MIHEHMTFDFEKNGCYLTLPEQALPFRFRHRFLSNALWDQLDNAVSILWKHSQSFRKVLGY